MVRTLRLGSRGDKVKMQLGTLLAALLVAALAVPAKGEESTTAADKPDADDEGDSAPFMVVVRHTDGRACAASLVTLRTALSSAACARPRRATDDVWVVAPADGDTAPGPRARRVLRIAYATGGDSEEEGVAGDPWAGAAADLALLELSAPLSGARAILMATDVADCAPPARCHLVRRLTSNTSLDSSGESGSRVRLRIVDARLTEGSTCAARGPRWHALRARTLCLSGPYLCESDWGTGVVCSGKLCGVLSRSADKAGEEGAGRERCGDVHAAPSVPRWRRFLHCAHTRDVCGRDGDCAELCKETLVSYASSPDSPLAAPLVLPPVESPPAPCPAPAAPPPPTPSAWRRKPLRTNQWPTTKNSENTALIRSKETAPLRTESAYTHDTMSSAAPSPTPVLGLDPSATSASTSALAVPPPPLAGLASQRTGYEFEPNRADFRMSPARTSRVFLKAGEYGDNAAEYAAPEEVPAATSTPLALPSPAAPSLPLPSPAAPSRSAPPPTPTRSASRTTANAQESAERVAARVSPVQLVAAASASSALQLTRIVLFTSMYLCYHVI